MTSVAITTDRFETVSPMYTELGMTPVPVPCVRVEPAAETVLRRAREAASHADLLLITSPRTVELLWPEGGMPRVRVAAVGRSSAAAVEAGGGRLVARGGSGLAALVEEAADLLRVAATVFPRATATDPAALASLRGVAPQLDEHLVYRTVPMAPGPTSVQAVTFASPSAVTGWLRERDFDELVVGVIGPTTEAAVAMHRPPDVVANEPSHHVLARAMASYLEVSI